eukprot:GHVT01097971.1.p1 GENE.GHVT01097971.1~~GHVT01097971.1.p1  ORF type:complete len:117 (-),score=20.01 GHVT01097971.1:173-523(-)
MKCLSRFFPLVSVCPSFSWCPSSALGPPLAAIAPQIFTHRALLRVRSGSDLSFLYEQLRGPSPFFLLFNKRKVFVHFTRAFLKTLSRFSGRAVTGFAHVAFDLFELTELEVNTRLH